METIKLEVSVEEVNLMLAALQELPFKHSNELILKVSNQAKEQVGQSEQAEQTEE